ncbi:transporter substrate-binding domain-containing protein [Corynebacterium suedekumii]|nr:transporter substrate-binding domain-containing protein [Corynebacterium suedekumii]
MRSTPTTCSAPFPPRRRHPRGTDPRHRRTRPPRRRRRPVPEPAVLPRLRHRRPPWLRDRPRPRDRPDIFGDPDRVDFRFVESASRVSALDNREVDMVIRTMTVTRTRQEDVQFSTPYLATDSRLLVMYNSAIDGVDDLPGRTVCVTDGSTALEKARKHAPQSRILKTRSWADCLLALQQHHADAILSDDTILSGNQRPGPLHRDRR